MKIKKMYLKSNTQQENEDEMKIKKMYLKSNTQQENFRTFEERDMNGIKSD